jgi:hypothetical protein
MNPSVYCWLPKQRGFCRWAQACGMSRESLTTVGCLTDTDSGVKEYPTESGV